MTTSVTVTPASTEPEVKGYTVAASVANSPITVGDTARVTLTIGNTDDSVTAYNAYDMTVTYNADVLKYDSVADVNGEKPNVVAGDGTLRITGYGSNKTCDTDNIVLSFTGKATGSADVTVTFAKVDAKANAIANDAPDANITAGTVTIVVGGYKVTLPDAFTGAGTANPGEDYTFTAKDKDKKYDFTGSTMGGKTVEIIDNGDGSYTVKNVTGELDIKATAKAQMVTIEESGNGWDDVKNRTGWTESGDQVEEGTSNLAFMLQPTNNRTYVVTANGTTIEGAPLQGGMMYRYAIPAELVKGKKLTINVTYTEPGTDTITIIGTGDAWKDVDHNSSVGWDESGKVTDKTSATLKIKPATGKTIDDYVVTINGVKQELTQMGKGNNTRYMVTFVPADEAVDGKIAIDVSYKKATEPTITVDVSEYLKQDGQSMFLITAACDELAEGKVLAYGENSDQMYWSEKYSAYAWLVISDKGLEDVKTEAAAQVKAVDGTKVEIAYKGDVNQTNTADINDAQLVWNMYNAEYKDDTDFQTVNRLKYLSADMNGDRTLDTKDAAAIIALITE